MGAKIEEKLTGTQGEMMMTPVHFLLMKTIPSSEPVQTWAAVMEAAARNEMETKTGVWNTKEAVWTEKRLPGRKRPRAMNMLRSYKAQRTVSGLYNACLDKVAENYGETADSCDGTGFEKRKTIFCMLHGSAKTFEHRERNAI